MYKVFNLLIQVYKYLNHVLNHLHVVSIELSYFNNVQ